jgi:hypothetical protein
MTTKSQFGHQVLTAQDRSLVTSWILPAYANR